MTGPDGHGNDLAPDEKVCPFCAETIKRAAVRCRYCHSDLPPTEEQAVPVAPSPFEPDVETPYEPPTEESGEEETQAPPPIRRRSALLGSSRLTAALVVLALVLGVGVGVAWHWRQDRQRQVADATALAQARTHALQQVGPIVQKAFTYDWTTFDADAKASEATMAPAFRQEYAATLAKARTDAITNQVKQSAQVSSTAVISAGANQVKTLVFMDVATTGKSGRQNVTTSRLVVTLTRLAGQWRISAITLV